MDRQLHLSGFLVSSESDPVLAYLIQQGRCFKAKIAADILHAIGCFQAL